MPAPTVLDRLVTSKNLFFVFAGMIVGASAWAIWRDDPILGSPDDPFGDPSEWAEPELLAWLRVRNITPSENETREELVDRVKANMMTRRVPPAGRS